MVQKYVVFTHRRTEHHNEKHVSEPNFQNPKRKTRIWIAQNDKKTALTTLKPCYYQRWSKICSNVPLDLVLERH